MDQDIGLLKKDGAGSDLGVRSDKDQQLSDLESIPTTSIMISTDVHNSSSNGHGRPHKPNFRRNSCATVPLQHAQEMLVAQMSGLEVSTEPCHIGESSHQRRRASVDESQFPTTKSGRGKGKTTIPRFPPGDAYISSDKRITLYKTEMCRTFEETGTCKYGIKCQFAHDRSELRNIQRHPRYKTEICKTFWEQGNCPYGKRCCFIHTENEVLGKTGTSPPMECSVPEIRLTVPSPEKNASRLLNRMGKSESIISSSLPVSESLSGTFQIPRSFAAAPWMKSSFKEDHFLDLCGTGPIGSPPAHATGGSTCFSIGSLHCKYSPKPIDQSLAENLSALSDNGSDHAWEEESIGLLPADLINSTECL